MFETVTEIFDKWELMMNVPLWWKEAIIGNGKVLVQVKVTDNKFKKTTIIFLEQKSEWNIQDKITREFLILKIQWHSPQLFCSSHKCNWRKDQVYIYLQTYCAFSDKAKAQWVS